MLMLIVTKGIYLLVLIFLSISTTTQADDGIRYSVISEVNVGEALMVIVDNNTFPLKESHEGSILYSGTAPSAKIGYRYIIIDENSGAIIKQEPFTRVSSEADESGCTFNEFFNRSTNIFSVNSLPKVSTMPTYIKKKTDTAKKLHIPNEIPTIHIYGNKTAIDHIHKSQLEDISAKLKMSFISLRETYTFDNVKVALSGRSSRWIPKLSYTLKLNKKDDSTLYGYRNFKLRALAHEPSYIRENICYNVFESVGIRTTGFSFVRLFIEGKAAGLYGLIETFQKPWVENTFTAEDNSSSSENEDEDTDKDEDDYRPGYLYQGAGSSTLKDWNNYHLSDLSYERNLTVYSAGQYEIKDGPSRDKIEDFKQLQQFTEFINDCDIKETSADDWQKQLDVHGFLKAMAIENLLGLSDGYMALADNFYLYRKPKDNHYIYIPVDVDTTIGISLFNKTLMLSGNYSDHPGIHMRPLTKCIFSYTAFSTAYEAMLRDFTDKLINPEILFPYIDSVVDMIRTDVEWDQSVSRLGRHVAVQEVVELPNATLAQELMTKLLPNGLIPRKDPTELVSPNITFYPAINGYSDVHYESVKGFITKKYNAIKEFYK